MHWYDGIHVIDVPSLFCMVLIVVGDEVQGGCTWWGEGGAHEEGEYGPSSLEFFLLDFLFPLFVVFCIL